MEVNSEESKPANSKSNRIRPEYRSHTGHCPLISTDRNIFHLMGKASETLRKNGMQEQADEMRNRIFQCKSYHSALSIIGDYVNITSAHQEECMDMEME